MSSAVFLLYFRLFNTVDSKEINVGYKSLPRLDSNRGPLASEATALPTQRSLPGESGFESSHRQFLLNFSLLQTVNRKDEIEKKRP